MTDSTQPQQPESARDSGSTLIIALVMIMLCSFLILPVMSYSTSVARASRLANVKGGRLEAVKGGLRTAMADPVALYKKCGYQDAANPGAGLYQPVTIAGPGLDIGVSTKCYMMDYAQSREGDSVGRYGAATIAVGATLPAEIVSGGNHAYLASGQAPETLWQNDMSGTETQDKIFVPDLPAHGLNKRANTGFAMPAGFNGFPACTVYFPGTYQDDLVITGSTPVFFASGIYYFEKTVRISGSATVVVGDGSTSGCASDQEAAFYAINAPTSHNITGLGATFVFGAAGRLLVDTDTAGPATSFVMNQRYVADNDVGTASSKGVSIMSVNGVLSGATNTDLNLTGFLSVPRSMVGGDTRTEATSQEYKPSTLVPTAPVVPPVTTTSPASTTTTTIAATTTTVPPPVINAVFEVKLATTQTVTVSIPGYISLPQGTMKVNITAGSEANKTLSIAGGFLAAKLEVSGTLPGKVGFDNPVVQQTFKIVSETTSGSPKVTSTAIVQVNQNGAYAINAWSVQ